MITYKVPSLKLEIGDHPIIYADHEPESRVDKYESIFNFSDEPPYGINKKAHPETEVHRHPINEFGYWTYQPFFFMVHLMDDAVARDRNVYVHCHAGAHRSPMMTYLYLRSLGNSPDEAYALFDDKYVVLGEKSNWLEETFQNDVEYGRIPADIVEFMKDVRKNKDISMMHVMKKRGGLDVSEKAKAKGSEKKPVGKEQLWQWKNGVFSKQD